MTSVALVRVDASLRVDASFGLYILYIFFGGGLMIHFSEEVQ